MQVEVSYRDISRTDAIESRILGDVEASLSRFAEQLTRVEVHVGDRNGPKKGPDDKRCMIEARPAGGRPLAVEAVGDDLYDTIRSASQKLGRALERHFARRDS